MVGAKFQILLSICLGWFFILVLYDEVEVHEMGWLVGVVLVSFSSELED